jgi:hypothetical protein
LASGAFFNLWNDLKRKSNGNSKILYYLCGQQRNGMIMCTRQQCIEKLRASIPFIQKEFGVNSLCLFGSTARGDNREDSDVDVYVDMPPKALKVSALKIFLQDLLGTSVDIVRKRPHLDNFLLNEIERDGIYIY